MTLDRDRPAPPDPDWGFDTLAVHAGLEPDALTGAVSPPIYQTSTFAQDGVERPRGGWEYARTGNPTRDRLERAIAALEGGSHGLAYASGAAATAAIASLVLPGEEVVISDDVYGGTFRLFERVLRETGIDARYVDLSREAPGDLPADRLRAQLSPRTRMVWIESPSNPLLKLVDIAAVASAAHAHRGARDATPIVVVDNTFATPVIQRPLALGADIVFHSATKYLAGHSDTVNGVLATSRGDLYDRLRFLQNAVGGIPGPFDCFLVLRGLRTLGLRVERHAANALRVATALAARPDVARVRYPGLADGPHAHPQAALAARAMRLPGGMVSFEPTAHDGRSAVERARRICESTRIFTLAESLGGVESLIEVPAVMTHGAVQGSALEVPAALVRLSVGIEDADDLVADLVAALDAA
ncbi:MAG: aminotransferase class I/II-fold pyridoxal phosphate-dependent enzyme [Chloroflexota bacterium]